MKELEIKDYIRIIRKRVWLVVALVVVATLLSGIVSKYVMNPIYQASTKIIVTKTSDLDIQQLNSDAVNMNIKLIDTYKEIIKTPAIMDKVAAQYPEFGLGSEQLIKKVGVSSVNNTQVMTVTVRDQSYVKAAGIVNAVSKVFQNEIPALMSVKNVAILNYAKEDKEHPKPVSPNVMMNVVIAFILSLLVGIGIAFLLEYLDDTVKTEEEVQQLLGLPTLAAIFKVNANEMEQWKRATGSARPSRQQSTESTKKTGEWENVTFGK